MSSKSVSPHPVDRLRLEQLAGFRPRSSDKSRRNARTTGAFGSLTRPVSTFVGGMCSLFLITAIYSHQPLVNVTTVGFTFLLAILIAAAVGSYVPSLAMSVVATLLYDYFFLPPIGTWNITDSRDWVALTAFVVTSIVGSSLSEMARRQTRKARRQRREAEELYDLSQRLLSAGDSLGLCNAIPQDIAEVFNTRAAALLLAEGQLVFYSVGGSHEFATARLKATLSERLVRVDAEEGITYVPLRLGVVAIGTVGIADTGLSHETLDALGSLITIAIERARAIEQVGKVEAMRESEKLKSALLDAITHEFRTPLTAMKISVTGMLSDLNFDRTECRELLTMIDEGCDRIDQLVGEVSQMSRIESGDVRLDLARHSVGELIDMALTECADSLESRPIERSIANEDVPVRIDLVWASKTLEHLIANANLYSTPGLPIVIRTETTKGRVLFHVVDGGPGIDPSEIERIFEKFYRGKDHRCRVQGTGMGLPIAKAIAEAHGGTMSVSSKPGEGAVFSFSLPIDRSIE
jgi:two-component system, OmpR family, sensor histidine kinase KdpD